MPNFTGAYEIEVEAATAHSNVPPLVRLCCSCDGPVSFHHSMTAAQAREMALHLCQCADAIERLS